jgi:hypothetical protein
MSHLGRGRIGAVLVVAATIVTSSCAREAPPRGDPAAGDAGLAPSFAPEPDLIRSTTTSAAASGSSASPPGPTSTRPSAAVGASGTATTTEVPQSSVGSTTGPAASARTAVSALDDPVGDITPSAERAPAWADVIGIRLSSLGDELELDVRLGGGSAPSVTDARHTLNLASFYDTDGDGDIEYQVWANLSSKGWGGSYFDDGPGGGPNRFGTESGVEVTVVGDVVRLRFPRSLLGGASTFRWSVATEWGSYETIGSLAAARDDAPDDDGSLTFAP